MRLIPLFLAGLLLLNSCEWINSLKETREPVARVKEKVLYMDEVLSLMPFMATKQDSLDFLKNFSEKWAEEQVMLDRAAYNLNEDLLDIDRKVQTYKNSLMIYAYEQALVSQKLDTNFSDIQISQYYNGHQEDFILREDVFRMIFLKLDVNSPRLSELKEWFNYDDEDEKNSLISDYCIQFALDYSLNDQTWWKAPDVLRRIPVSADSLDMLSNAKDLVEFQKADYLYLIDVLDHKDKATVAPLSLVENSIRDILLNDRKVRLVKKLRKGIINDALNKNHIEYYIKE